MASQPTPAAFTKPLLILFLVAFSINAGSGVALWTQKTQFWRVIHGWSLPPFLIVFGVIWRFHILRGWKLKKNVLSGMITLAVFLLLTISGWVIYYSGSENMQKVAGTWHTWIGLATSFILLAHVVFGWQSRDKTVL